MSDLISRQNTADAMERWLYDVEDRRTVREVVYELPSAEPERKKGKWTATYSDCGGDVWVSWKCSNCGYVRKKGWEHNGGEKPDALFCEMCNADMRGTGDNSDE